MITGSGSAAFGDEVIDVSDDQDLVRLVREAHDEAAALAGLEDNLDRLRRARAAQTALAGLPADQLREALRMRRDNVSQAQP